MKSPRWLPALIASAALLVLTGCGTDGGSGATNPTDGASVTTMPSDMPMSPGMKPAADRKPGRAPTETASMVCDEEIRSAVTQTFALDAPVVATSTWQGGLFTCTYRLPEGALTVAVKDELVPTQGRAYFDALRAFDGAPALLTGLQAFGLPAYETTDGRVVFLKDGKTLVADAGLLPRVAGPQGESRTDVAYAIAADVIGCWSE